MPLHHLPQSKNKGREKEMKIEDLVMAHRYLYYVEAAPVLSDHAYDVLERKARATLPDTSPVQGIGSSLPDSYTEKQIKLAEKLMKDQE